MQAHFTCLHHVFSHLLVPPIIHVNEPRVFYVVMSPIIHVNKLCLFHVLMSPMMHMNKLCVFHMLMSPIIHINKPCVFYVLLSPIIHMNKPCVFHVLMSHIRHVDKPWENELKMAKYRENVTESNKSIFDLIHYGHVVNAHRNHHTYLDRRNLGLKYLVSDTVCQYKMEFVSCIILSA